MKTIKLTETSCAFTKSAIIPKSIFRFLPVLFLSLILSPQGYAQLDSLRNLVYSPDGFVHDTVEINTRYEYALEVSQGLYDSFAIAIHHLDVAYDLAKQNESVIKQIDIASLKGYLQLRLGDFEEAITTYDKAIGLAQSNNMELLAWKIKDKKSKVYLRTKDDDLSLSLKLKALEVFKEHADSNAMSECYAGIAGLYLSKGGFEDCIRYSNLSLETSSKINPSDTEATLRGNLAMAYKRLGQPESALFNYLKCRELSKDDIYLHRNNELELARFYIRQKEDKKGIKIFEDLIALYPEESNNYSLQIYRLEYAHYLQKKGLFLASTKVLTKINLDVLEGRPFDLQIYYKVSSRLNYESGKYADARKDFRWFRNYRDTLLDDRVKSNFKEIEEKYNVAEKEKVIASQDLALRNRMIAIISILGLSIIGGLLFYQRQRKLKYQKALSDQKNIAQKAEIVNLRKENKIISMQSMLEGQEEERLRIARDLHDNIGSLMTTIKLKVLEIQNKIKSIEKINITGELDTMITTASQEIRRISHRMTPVALELAGLEGAIHDLGQQLDINNIKLIQDVDQLEQVTDKNLSINIYRIIQEIVNNTIKHSQASEMTISADIKDNIIKLIIRDNGVGFDSTNAKQSKSIGLSGIQSRITYLNGTVEINSMDKTEYKISIPMKSID